MSNTATTDNAVQKHFPGFCKKKRPEQPVSRILFLRTVTRIEGDDHSSGMPVTRHLKRPTRELERAALYRSPIWSCTGWGLPSFPGHPENWCALTAPFHPYPAVEEIPRDLCAGRFAFCCTCLRVAATPRYGAPCPTVFGLSSNPDCSGPAITCSTPTALFVRVHCPKWCWDT